MPYNIKFRQHLINLYSHSSIVADTCVSMDQWVENPTAHSALSEVLPCVDNATANDILSISKHVTFLMVGIVNQFITNVANNDVPPNAGPFYYNQSGPLVPILCNPLNFDNTDRRCTAGEMDLSNATQVNLISTLNKHLKACCFFGIEERGVGL